MRQDWYWAGVCPTNSFQIRVTVHSVRQKFVGHVLTGAADNAGLMFGLWPNWYQMTGVTGVWIAMYVFTQSTSITWLTMKFGQKREWTHPTQDNFASVAWKFVSTEISDLLISQIFRSTRGTSQREIARVVTSVMCQNSSMHDLMDLPIQKSPRAKFLVALWQCVVGFFDCDLSHLQIQSDSYIWLDETHEMAFASILVLLNGTLFVSRNSETLCMYHSEYGHVKENRCCFDCGACVGLLNNHKSFGHSRRKRLYRWRVFLCFIEQNQPWRGWNIYAFLLWDSYRWPMGYYCGALRR